MILEDNPQRRPQTFGGLVYLVITSMALTGLVFVVAGAWRPGVSWMGAGLLVGSAFRLVLPERRAGMLRVRRKAEDVLLLLVAGVALLVLAVVVPNQPG
ncbi:MAG: hypothetical protein AVDCRST_MAG72-222 [uncultured Nocardioidaceae bacterium]|uniref:DUF3017 domain-containing protein n=1 Tax=uncultured Nocardioidaceae bacterium TaxID=253824 RepID=A0A6J4LG13_9ACTN|nr:MAG: hypothetical protein AVDCRST_MAG72-222 [uncultured Nocardioidaceae bacterium]